MNASALIVGIDGCNQIPQLSGSALDALEAADWLLAIGVPPERIRLHAEPQSGQTLTAPVGVAVNPPSRDAIWASILAIKKESGDRLYVFLSGHGYYLAELGPIFLTKDWSEDFPDKNIDILSFAGFFRSLSFRDQLFVVDACQSYAMDSVYRSRVPASKPNVPAWTPDPQNALTLCCAADQGQFAVVVDGRGLLTRNLLATLKDAQASGPPSVARDALVYDWSTGSRKLDLNPLFELVISPAVIQAAAANHATQTPTIQPQGRATREGTCIIINLDQERAVPFKVEAAPEEGIDMMRFELRPPVRELSLPVIGSASHFPFAGVAPLGARLIVSCVPVAGWGVQPPMADVHVPPAGVTLNFVLTPPPTTPGQLTQFNVKLVRPDGSDAFEINTADYEAVGVARGGAAAPGEPNIVPHENGPDILMNGAPLQKAQTTAERLRDLLTARMSARQPGLEIFISPPGKTIEQARPNLRLEQPPGGPASLAGFLVREQLVKVERIGGNPLRDGKALSLERLSKRSLLRVDPGLYRVRVELPWGAGSSQVEVYDTGVAVCSLPAIAGLEPLRNAVARGEVQVPEGRQIVMLPNRDDVADNGNAVGGPLRLQPIEPAAIEGVTVLLQQENGTWRAEPYSDLPWVEWDLLIGAGRLGAVDLQKAAERLEGARLHPTEAMSTFCGSP